jgi:hypothetical protein
MKTINDDKILELVNGGWSLKKIADYFGVSKTAIHKRKKKLRGLTVQVLANVKIDRAVDQNLDSIQQLKTINQKANNLLDKFEEDPKIAVPIMAEIRAQLSLQLQIFSSFYDLQAAKEFREEVIAVIEQIDPEVKNEIIRRLNKRRATQSAIKFA